MFKSKKAQAAMEFLMTYGWALLVVLIAIAALAFFGLLNPSRFLPEKCTVPPGFGCGGYSANTTDLTLFLTNGNGETVYNLEVNIPECVNGDPTADVSKANLSVEGQLPATVSVNVSEGNTVALGLKCNVTNALTAGDRLRGTLNITYQTRFENTMQNHMKSGDLIVAVQ